MIIESYLDLVQRTKVADKETNALSFWAATENALPALALLAKKYLSVPASSAAVERMFSICGHVFSTKRRKLGVAFFVNLVWLKLNEILL